MYSLSLHCTQALFGHGDQLKVLFLGGLLGSLTHCLVMCGPFVACHTACGGSCSKFSETFQLPYHGGRLLAYGGLGFAVSFLSKQLASYEIWPLLSAALLVFSGILFIGSGIFPNRHIFVISSKNALMRGVLMGFMPCGLLYAALMVVGTITNPFLGMIGMWCFVLGTVPALLASSSVTVLLAKKWQQTVRFVGRFGLILNGLILFAMAGGITR